MRRLLGVLAIVLALVAVAGPAHADALPALNVTAVGGVAHDIASGWKKPYFFVSETVLGPHYGPVYIGGVGLAQDPKVGTVIPFVTYVAQGKLHGWFRGVALQVGQRRQGIISGSPGYYFLVGASR